MGRIKTQLVKRITKKLMDLHGEAFTEDFGQNKKLVTQWVSESSLKLRNTIAGYVTRLKKKGYTKGYIVRGPSSMKMDPSEMRERRERRPSNF